ncbi:unnamed protein product [Arctia plantaginis]|uniref:Uncharacterized protein n=1 Tax=Arctia plantaginis TaxID=874455 RepID=A0A8S0YVG7_ARCPL|nr:unnamed protein product [Arctia plantaginis]
MGIRRVWWSSLRRYWWTLAVAVALLAALCLRWPAEYNASDHFPRVQPHTLAHLLADFSHQPNIGSWSVVEDDSNYTTWRYAVTYECGSRCAGRAAVEAHDEPPRATPEHGAAARHHRVHVQLRACTTLPLLPWPVFCDELQTVALVVRSGDSGSELTTVWRAHCTLLDAVRGACASDARAHRDALLLRVRAALRA